MSLPLVADCQPFDLSTLSLSDSPASPALLSSSQRTAQAFRERSPNLSSMSLSDRESLILPISPRPRKFSCLTTELDSGSEQKTDEAVSRNKRSSSVVNFHRAPLLGLKVQPASPEKVMLPPAPPVVAHVAKNYRSLFLDKENSTSFKRSRIFQS